MGTPFPLTPSPPGLSRPISPTSPSPSTCTTTQRSPTSPSQVSMPRPLLRRSLLTTSSSRPTGTSTSPRCPDLTEMSTPLATELPSTPALPSSWDQTPLSLLSSRESPSSRTALVLRTFLTSPSPSMTQTTSSPLTTTSLRSPRAPPPSASWELLELTSPTTSSTSSSAMSSCAHTPLTSTVTTTLSPSTRLEVL